MQREVFGSCLTFFKNHLFQVLNRHSAVHLEAESRLWKGVLFRAAHDLNVELTLGSREPQLEREQPLFVLFTQLLGRQLDALVGNAELGNYLLV